jgi:hypothetical protein
MVREALDGRLERILLEVREMIEKMKGPSAKRQSDQHAFIEAR